MRSARHGLVAFSRFLVRPGVLRVPGRRAQNTCGKHHPYVATTGRQCLSSFTVQTFRDLVLVPVYIYHIASSRVTGESAKLGHVVSLH